MLAACFIKSKALQFELTAVIFLIRGPDTHFWSLVEECGKEKQENANL